MSGLKQAAHAGQHVLQPVATICYSQPVTACYSLTPQPAVLQLVPLAYLATACLAAPPGGYSLHYYPNW